MSVLVTGGAGYIGSHTVAELLSHGKKVVVLDHLGKGHRSAISGVPVYEVDIRDQNAVEHVLREHQVETVVHFAANSLVGESVQNPLQYYENNVVGSKRLLSAMAETGVKQIVFSSTAATYGEPIAVPIREDHPTAPTNPYGETKLAIERMLHWCYRAYGIKSISLRYFNAAGAHPTLPIGEHHDPETHLIPIVLQVALGQRTYVSVFGDDYPTPDGTCIRDYIHVMDLASAHRMAIGRLRMGGGVEAFNLGIGKGFSVLEVIEAARVVTGKEIPVTMEARRAGDPAVLVACSENAKSVLDWHPQWEDLHEIVASAWKWHSSHPTGFPD